MKRNTFFLLVTMAALLTMPTTLTAQIGKKGGLFNKDMTEENTNGLLNYHNNRDEIYGSPINNQTFGQQVPVGSGLFVLAMAGAGYAMMRRKRSRKNTQHANGTMLLALIVLLSMTQCNKADDPIAPVNDDNNAARIVLNVNRDSRHVVNPSTGEVTFEPYMDYLLVGNNGKFCGYLDYDGTSFVGDLDGLTEDEYLYLYFLGGLPTAGLNNGDETWTVDISDQQFDFPVLSCARSNEKYSPEVNTYSCTLLNQCALVNFHFLDNITSSVTMPDMLVSATVDFANHTIVPTPNAATGSIKLRGTGSNDKWAILLPNENSITTTVSVGDKHYVVDVPPIEANDYLSYDNGNAVIIGHEFSVSATNKVSFAPGNLQYKAGDGGGWRFAENQYDYVGSWNTSNWVDIFGWGTWDGVKDPLNIPVSNTEYDWNGDFNGTILNNTETGWRTPTGDEWDYLLKTRTDAASKYGSATVFGKHGIIILPDKMVLPDNFTFNSGVDGWNRNTPTDEQWSLMESYGAVFLPAAGLRDDTNSGTNMDILELCGDFGAYWSSSYLTNVDPFSFNNYAYDISFGSNQFNIGEIQSYLGLIGGFTNQRAIGHSVRLVR